jgi:hypothetical protein
MHIYRVNCFCSANYSHNRNLRCYSFPTWAYIHAVLDDITKKNDGATDILDKKRKFLDDLPGRVLGVKTLALELKTQFGAIVQATEPKAEELRPNETKTDAMET